MTSRLFRIVSLMFVLCLSYGVPGCACDGPCGPPAGPSAPPTPTPRPPMVTPTIAPTPVPPVPTPTPTPHPPTPTPTPVPTPPPPVPTPTPAATCRYAVQGSNQHYPYQGMLNGGFSVSADPSNCPWSAVSRVGWVGITSTTQGVGGGGRYNVAGNGGAYRVGTIDIIGTTMTLTVTITQDARP